jgi:hypothetical protein
MACARFTLERRVVLWRPGLHRDPYLAAAGRVRLSPDVQHQTRRWAGPCWGWESHLSVWPVGAVDHLRRCYNHRPLVGTCFRHFSGSGFLDRVRWPLRGPGYMFDGVSGLSAHFRRNAPLTVPTDGFGERRRLH